MSKKIILSFIIFNYLFIQNARSEVKTLSWFKQTNCSELNIYKYKSVSNDNVIASTTIKDPDIIKEIMNRIQELPTNGDKMKSFGPDVKKTSLHFLCNNEGSEVIEIYNDKFKTPSTGFLSETADKEKNLVLDIEAIVHPELNMRLPKLKDHLFKFKNFRVKYTGSKHTPQPKDGPTIGPTNLNYYTVVKDGEANKMNFSIFDGQLPPQPQAFVIDKKTYYILTYQGLKNESLAPNYFMISDKEPKR